LRNLSQNPNTSILLGDIRRMIEDAQAAVASVIIVGLTIDGLKLMISDLSLQTKNVRHRSSIKMGAF